MSTEPYSQEKDDLLALCEFLGFPPSLTKQSSFFSPEDIRLDLESLHEFLHMRGYRCSHCLCGHNGFDQTITANTEKQAHQTST